MTTATLTASGSNRISASNNGTLTERPASAGDIDAHAPAPWQDPSVVINTREPVFFRRLKNRLAAIPVASKHRHQSLFIDLRTGQHWLQLKLTRPEFTLYMLPVSIDTALSIASESDYRRWNPALFPQYDTKERMCASTAPLTA